MERRKLPAPPRTRLRIGQPGNLAGNVRSGRFVILEHRLEQGVHWDFMLEWGEVLRTWSLQQPPDSGGEIAATGLPDHRKQFLDYEGPISEGRGNVSRWSHGEYRLLEESPQTVQAELVGQKVAGRVTLSRHSDEAAVWAFLLE